MKVCAYLDDEILVVVVVDVAAICAFTMIRLAVDLVEDCDLVTLALVLVDCFGGGLALVVGLIFTTLWYTKTREECSVAPYCVQENLITLTSFVCNLQCQHQVSKLSCWFT